MAATLVQSRVQTNVNSLAFSSPVTAGNTIVVFLTGYAGGGANFTATSDNQNGSHSNALTPVSLGSSRLGITYRANVAAGSTTVSITGTGGDKSIVITEWAGLDNADLIDIAAATATGTSTAPAASATGTLGAAGNLVLALVTHLGGNIAITEDTADGFTLIQEAQDGGAYMPIGTQYLVAGSTSSVTANWTLGSSQEWAVARVVLNAAAGGGTSIEVGQATETDSAQPVSASKAATSGQASETDTAQPVDLSKLATGGQAVETDSAQPVTATKTITLGIAVETDTAQPVSSSSATSTTVGQAEETDSAQPLSISKVVTLGIAVETDSATAIELGPDVTTVGQAAETDTALTLTITKVVTLGQAVETDSADAVTPSKAPALGQAVETDTAQAVTRSKATVELGQALETDTAAAVTLSKAITLGVATETDVAQLVSAVKTLALTLAVEEDVALGLLLLAQFVPTLSRTMVVRAQPARVSTVGAASRVTSVAAAPRVSVVQEDS